MPQVQPKGPFKINQDALRLANESVILAAARAYVDADVTVQPEKMTYMLADAKDNFARINVGTGEGGYSLVLKKVHDIWVVIVAGQGLPGQDAAKKYGLPAGWFSTEY